MDKVHKQDDPALPSQGETTISLTSSFESDEVSVGSGASRGGESHCVRKRGADASLGGKV